MVRHRAGIAPIRGTVGSNRFSICDSVGVSGVSVYVWTVLTAVVSTSGGSVISTCVVNVHWYSAHVPQIAWWYRLQHLFYLWVVFVVCSVVPLLLGLGAERILLTHIVIIVYVVIVIHRGVRVPARSKNVFEVRETRLARLGDHHQATARHRDTQVIAVIHGVLDVTAFGRELAVVRRTARMQVQREGGVLRQRVEDALEAIRTLDPGSRTTGGVVEGAPAAVRGPCGVKRAYTVEVTAVTRRANTAVITPSTACSSRHRGDGLRAVDGEHVGVPGEGLVGVEEAAQHGEGVREVRVLVEDVQHHHADGVRGQHAALRTDDRSPAVVRALVLTPVLWRK